METRMRRRMLAGLWESDISRRLNERLTPGRICNLGRPMQSLNLFASTVRQLAVQYDAPPTVTNPALLEAAGLVWQNIVEKSHLWNILQQNSENVIGLRESFIQVEWTDGGLRLVSVTADTVTTESAPNDPDRILVMRVARAYKINGRSVPAFAVWDVRNQAAPVFRVEDAEGGDISRQVIPDPQPWPYYIPGTATAELPLGTPFLPFVKYRAQDTSEPWDAYAMAELVHAALDVAILWTAWGKVVLDASWAQRWVIDLMLAGLSVANAGSAGATATVEADPTSILVFNTKGGGASGQVGQFATPADPAQLASAVQTFQASVLSNIGIHPSDIEAGAGPQSGVAIQLKRSSQRRLAMRMIPQFRAGDTELFSKMAMIYNIFSPDGSPEIPVVGWEIAYHLPDATVEEFITELDRDERMVRLGFMSKVDLMMKYRPELNREQAIIKLGEIIRDNMLYPMVAG
jgi:hypothetical protein